MKTHMNTIRNCFWVVAGAAILLGLPLLGVQMAGQPLPPYLEFPPVTHYVVHAGFSWPVFIGLAAAIAAMVAPFLLKVTGFRVQGSGSGNEKRFESSEGTSAPEFLNPEPLSPHPFPSWGWLGVLALIVSWLFAWMRFPWFAPLQPFTFSPLWFSYIVIMNALAFRRSGHCMMLDRPGRFLLLFPASAAFWWFFEYLNRFAQNWHYEGTGALTPLQYFLFATLPFSTVLPAVLGTHEFLGTFPRLSAGLDRFRPLRVRRPNACAIAALCIAAASLTWLGVCPDYLFPMLWIAPLAVILSFQVLAGRRTLLAPLESGNWRNIWLLAMAALICGFFWEMWNYLSLAKWIYAVPFVNRFHVFEMPVLGYAGYLPFGLECAVIADMIVHRAEERRIRV